MKATGRVVACTCLHTVGFLSTFQSHIEDPCIRSDQGNCRAATQVWKLLIKASASLTQSADIGQPV